MKQRAISEKGGLRLDVINIDCYSAIYVCAYSKLIILCKDD